MRKFVIFALCPLLIIILSLQGWALCFLPTGAGDYLLTPTLGECDAVDEAVDITDKILDLTFALDTSGFT